MYQYSFSEQLRWSQGIAPEGFERVLLNRIPACIDIEKADVVADKSGTDYWAVRVRPLPPLSIDLKVRKEDWALKGEDDLALETWSVIGKKVGWTRDDTKRSDYILWFWNDTKRFCLVPFHPLCRAFRSKWELWKGIYRCDQQSSGTWQSECVFVPRMVVYEAMQKWQEGHVPK